MLTINLAFRHVKSTFQQYSRHNNAFLETLAKHARPTQREISIVQIEISQKCVDLTAKKHVAMCPRSLAHFSCMTKIEYMYIKYYEYVRF